MNFRTIEEFDIARKRVVIRVDLNVPIRDEVILNTARVKAIIPTIEYCLRQHAEVVLLSHLGRPKGTCDPKFTLQPVAQELERFLNHPVEFVEDWRTRLRRSADSEYVRDSKVLLVENIRFEPGEESNSNVLGEELASLGDLYVMEAFGTLHRAHASTYKAVQTARQVGIGFLLAQELRMLSLAMVSPERPLVVVIGGSKVSSKFKVVQHLLTQADAILIGGGMANTFLLAMKHTIGTSLVETEFLEEVSEMLSSGRITVPHDVMVCDGSLDEHGKSIHRLVNEVKAQEMIVDIGPDTARCYAKLIKQAGTVIWNGPMGMFEYDQFGEGTRVVGEAIGESSAFTLAGGGETIAAIDHNDLSQQLDYISTGGGAFLEFIQGATLPGISALSDHACNNERCCN